MILTLLVTLGLSNVLSASSPFSFLDCRSKEELLSSQVLRKKHCHHKCCRRGPRGKQGIPGPQGPIGPSGPAFSTFISLFALEQQTIAVGDPILFDAVSAQNGSITWPGANNGEIVISTAGIYQISFGIQPLFNVRISLQVNHVNVPGGTLNIDISIPFSGLTLDVAIPANATISLVNTGISPANLQSAGPDPDATIAFIEIHRIL